MAKMKMHAGDVAVHGEGEQPKIFLLFFAHNGSAVSAGFGSHRLIGRDTARIRPIANRMIMVSADRTMCVFSDPIDDFIWTGTEINEISDHPQLVKGFRECAQGRGICVNIRDDGDLHVPNVLGGRKTTAHLKTRNYLGILMGMTSQQVSLSGVIICPSLWRIVIRLMGSG